MLKLINIHKTVGRKANPCKILTDISLDVESGTMVALVGPSGCGKTTLLNVIAGLDPPTKGTVLLGGEDIYEMSESRRDVFRGKHIGVVFQNYNLVPDLTCYENIILPHVFSGTAKECEAKAKELAQLLKLQDLLNKYPYQMSGGEQQRTAIARAAVQTPQLIVADEPTGALDSENSENVLSAFADMRRYGAYSFIIVTHNDEIAQKCDRIIRMADGRLLNSEPTYI